MSRNGSGTYNLPAGNPVVPGTVITSSWANTTLNDVASALTQSLSSDGQTVPTANLPMGNFKHTAVSDANQRNQYASYGQVQDGQPQWLSVSGTNTIVATIAPGPTSYAAGQAFRFLSAGLNTGPVTLNINGLGAKAVTKNGAVALAGGEIPASAIIHVVYDGTQFQLAAVPTGQLIGIQRFTANGTYTPTPGTTSIIVEAVGAGGGGAGSATTGVGQASWGSGGGSGAFARVKVTTAFSGVTVTVGASGVAGGSGGNGAAGGTTSFGAIVSCPGGGGGVSNGVFTAGQTTMGIGAAGGTAPTISGATTIISSQGRQGLWAGIAQVNGATGGGGAGSFFGEGPSQVVGTAAGNAATSFGAGGGGACSAASVAGPAGGAGGGGLVVVYEYS